MWCPTNASQFPVVGYPLKLHGHPYAQLQAWIPSASIFHFVGTRSLLSVEGQRHSAYNRIFETPSIRIVIWFAQSPLLLTGGSPPVSLHLGLERPTAEGSNRTTRKGPRP